jgi:AcrR family transcriptional regulator
MWDVRPFMGRMYHETMATPYAATGRSNQKARTRDALIAAARQVLSDGEPLSVQRVAEVAGISRTTAYRYFPNPEALALAAHPEIEHASLLGDRPSEDVRERLDAVLTEHFRIIREWEPQLRAALATSLQAADRPVLRRGRAIGWIADALAPLSETHPAIDTRALAVRIRAVAGIESLVWLVDIAGISRRRAFELMRRNAHAVLSDELGLD